jgi:hypothetical protein
MSLSVSCDTRPRIYRTTAASNPRPRPALGVGDQPGGDRVLEDVLQRGLQLLVVFDRFRREALAEHVVTATVEGVESAGVVAVEVAHPGGEVCLPRLDDEVIVVAHQAARVQPPAVAPDDAAELVQEDAAVVVVQEAELFVVAAGRDVVPRTGGEIASAPCHPATVARATGLEGPAAAFVPRRSQTCHREESRRRRAADGKSPPDAL